MSVLLVKQRADVSKPPFGGGLTGNICDSSLAGWKARSRLPIGYHFFSSLSTRVTDRQTDGQNYDPQDRASIAASRGKKSVNSYTNRRWR